MNVLFNASSLYPPKTGVGYYSENLIRELVLLKEDIRILGWHRNKLYSCCQMLSLGIEDSSDLNFKSVTRKFAKRVTGGFFNLPVLGRVASKISYSRECWESRKILHSCSEEGFLYHETNFIVAPYSGAKIVTIHDLSHERFPEHQRIETTLRLNQRIEKSLVEVGHIIADSHFTKKEIVELYNINPEKISVVLLGVSSTFAPLPEQVIEATLRSLGLRFNHYILSVCTLQPRKNLVRLVNAYSRLPSSVRRSLPLVLTGISGWKNAELFDVIGPMIDRKEVYLLGYIPQDVLVQLYAGAAIFAYPSLYEGFGLPVLEAMASGTPVLTSNNSSIPEVAAGAAIEVDPYSTDDILQGLDRLVTDVELRSSLVERGMERAKYLTWRRTAQETLAVYNRVSK